MKEHFDEDHLPVLEIRPRFQINTNLSMDEIENRINSNLHDPNSNFLGSVQHGYGTLSIPFKEQHFWSPQLTFSMEETEEGTLVRGLFGPRPSVWTMFIFFYAIIGFAIMIVSIIGFSNLSINQSGAILWSLPILIAVFLTIYISAYFGKRLGRDQMIILHRYFEKSSGLRIP
jgi:hypothetical protein